MTVDVAVLGDGPAGSALAGELRARDVDVVLIGADRPWTATYGMWADELDGVRFDGERVDRVRPDCVADSARADSADGPSVGPAAIAATISPEVRLVGGAPHVVTRPYLVADNPRLARALRRDVPHRVARIERIEHPVGERAPFAVVDSAGSVRAHLVVDCAGGVPGGSRGTVHPMPAYQTAFGAVLAEPPRGPLGAATVMDFTPPPALAGDDPAGDAVSFVYALPLGDGWLVEETVLAARPDVAPDHLTARLAARLGVAVEELTATALRTERVRFPMTSVLPERSAPVVSFGAAAGFVHPATGYSVAASLRAAGRVAEAIADACAVGLPRMHTAQIHDAVWPPPLRRTRRLHEYGLEVVLGLDASTTRQFFDTFFELPVDRWAPYMRIDTPPRELSEIMLMLFRSAPWSVRRRLMSPSAATRMMRLLHATRSGGAVRRS